MSDEERERGIREAEEAVMIYGNIAKTGNETLGIILTEKSLLCERHKIRFTYMIDGEQLDFMDPVDIASLFGNAPDNAIESVLRTDDAERRIIRLNASVKRSFFSVHFENYCGETVVFRDGMLQTVKQDNRYHGFRSNFLPSATSSRSTAAPSAWVDDPAYDDTYTEGARGAPSFLFAAVRICARADGFAQARFFRAGRGAGSPKVHSKNKST